MSAFAAKRTVFAAVSALLFVAICIAGPAGGAQRDRIRPTAPTNPHVTGATPTSVTIAWGASADNVGVAGYDVYHGSKRTRVARTAYVLRSLACGSGFAVAVAAVDSAGNRSPKMSVVAASAACSDATPPSAPTGFRQAATSEDAVVLTWQPSNDDVGVVSYGVYDKLTRISSEPESTTTLTGLGCGSTEVLSIDAVDAAGNRSDRRAVYVEAAPCASPQRMTVLSATSASEWVRCASEGQRCAFSGTSEVRYGANGAWTNPRSFTDGIDCTNRVFGDPIYGVGKSCEVRSGGSAPVPPTPPTAEWTHCAREGATCSFTDTREVRYGANGTWTSPRTVTNGVVCTNRTFGDPIYGVAKSCESRGTSSAPPLPTPPTPRPPTPRPPTPSPDTTPPAKPILSLGTVTRESATLNWQPGVDNVGVDHYAVWLDGRRIADTTATSHTHTGLQCNTQYVLGLQVVDGAGNTSVLGEALWPIRTSACLSATGDSVPPSVPSGLGITSATTTSVRLGWSPSSDNVGVAGYRATRNGALAATVSAPAATIESLACGTSYEFGVEAFDAAGNSSPDTSVVGSTTTCADSQPPTAPTNVSASSRTATSIALSWSASSDNVGVIGYGLYSGGVLVSTVSGTPGIFVALVCNRNYTLAVDAYDASGNRSPRVTVAAGTTACADTTPPSTPSGLAASSVTQTGMTLNWSPSTDNVGVAGYDVYRGGTKVATTGSTSSAQVGLACGTSYGYSVQAFDAAGNRSAQVSIAVTTAACASSPPPPPTGAALAVSPSGNDSTCVRGDLSRPCGTFNRAYQLAQCGDGVNVQPGSYGAQNIVDSSPAKSCSTAGHIVFKPASGSVTVQKLNFGQFAAGNGGDWIEVRDMAVSTRVEPLHGSSHIRVIRVNGGSFLIHATHDVYLEGNDWGPCASSGTPNCSGQNFIDANYGNPLGTYNIEINGDTFRDFTITPGSGDHFECLFITGANGKVTIRNSRFYNCETYGIFFQANAGNHGFDNADFLIENNWFGRTCCFGTSERNSAVTFASALPPKNVLIRFNSFAPGQGVVSEGGATPSNVRVLGNILGTRQCMSGVSYAFNISLVGGCASSDRVVTQLPYVNPSGRGDQNYHLVASSSAEGFVTSQSADALLSRDIDGDARGQARDAGSDER